MEIRSHSQQIEAILADVAAQRLTEDEAYLLIKAVQNAESRIFEYSFAYEDLLLRDHQLFGARILMGVTHCSLAIEALREKSADTAGWRLERISFQDAIQIAPGNPVQVRVNLTQSENGFNFSNDYHSSKEGTSRVSASGRATALSAQLSSRLEVEALLNQADAVEEGSSFYSRQQAYGPSLQVLEKIYRLDGEIISSYALAPVEDAKPHFAANPSFFDSCYVNTLCAAGWDLLGESLWVPLFIKEVEVRLPLPDRWFCRTQLTRKNEEVLVSDHEMFDEQGSLLGVIRGFTVKRVPSAEALGIKPELVERAESSNTDQLYNRIELYLKQQISPMLNCKPEEVLVDRPFLDLGANSANLIGVVEKIEKEIGIELFPTIFFEYQNIKDLSGFFEKEHAGKFAAFFGTTPIESSADKIDPEISVPSSVKNTAEKSKDIAVIGMAGRFAKSRNLKEFWGHLRDRTNLISEIPKDHWDYRPWFDAAPQQPNRTYCKWGSFLDGIDQFDPLFFNISPPEADFTDPQLRHLLQVLFETVEDAGYARTIWGSKTGMYLGVCFKEYWDEIVRQRVPITGMESFSSAMSFLANRPSYFFDLRGPSVPVDDACSSSLVALHLACRALQNGECEMAFAAGTNVLLSPLHYVYFSAIGALSPTGRCHTFDASADGYVPGEGIAAVLLKPLDCAMRDGDNIHAVIKGSALNHGGRANNPTSPRTQLQTEVIQSAWRDAGISPETIGYIEAHGTGTLLGDPIEVEALKKAFKPFTDRSHFCGLGSVKANIGHTEGTAGIAGVIKAILCMKHGFIPAMPGLSEVNPYLKLGGSPFFINAEGREWAQPKEHPRRAGVSSFGMGGAYAHVVVEDYADNRVSQLGDGLHCFVLSAQNEARLKEYAGRYSEFLANSSENVSLPDLCYSLRIGRQPMDQRLAIVFQSKEELKELLNVYRSDLKHPDIFTGKRSASSLKVETKGEPRDRASCRELTSVWVTGADVQWDKWNDGKRISLPTYPFERRRCWMPPTGREGPDFATVASSVLGPFIDSSIPSLNGALFVKSFSGAENLLKDHCVFGEPVLPGVAHLEMALAAARLLHPGEKPVLRNVFWKRPILVGADGLRCEINLKSADSSLAWSICSGVNEYTTGLIDFGAGHGSPERIFDIALIKSRLSQKEQGTNLYGRFAAVGIEYGPLFRTVKQVWVSDREVLSEIVVEGSELRSTRALDAMLQSALALYRKGEEIVDPCLPFAFDSAILGTDFPSVCFGYLTADTPPKPGEEAAVNFFLLNTDGVVLAEIRNLNLRLARRTQSSPVSSIPPIQYFRPRWKKESQDIRLSHSPGKILVFHHESDFALAEACVRPKLGQEAVFVQLDSQNEKLDRNRYAIDGQNFAHFGAVLGELNSIETVYFLGALPFGPGGGFTLQEACRWNACSFLHLVQALPSEQKLALKVLTRNVYSVTGMEDLQPCGAIAIGLAKVTAREFSNWTVSCIDIDEISNGLIESMDHEVRGECSFRNGERFVRVLDAVELPPTAGTGLPQNIPFREKGVYLIAGGKGGLGLALSEYLAKEFKARLILLGRSPIDPQQAVLLQRLESLGGEVLYIQADISDSAEMKMALKTATDRFGRINGLVHSALVLADQAVARLDDKNLFSVLQPKVEGTIALEEVTRDEPLDFVLFFSSLNSFLANAGQANYVAGCAFQDAFAESLRRDRRCPVYTINWGLWGEVGIMARQGELDRFSRLGVYPIGVSEGIESCERILASDISQMIAAKIDSTALAASGLRIEGPLQLLPSGFSHSVGVNDEISAIRKSAAANVESWKKALQEIDEFCVQRLSNIPGLPGTEPPKTWKPKFHSLWSAAATLLINQGGTVFDGERNSVFEAHFELAGRCLDAFTDIVSGKVAATEVLFPNSSMELLESIYSGNPFADFYNELSAESVGIYLRRLLQAVPDRTIRILEIGAGTGGTSRFVLEKIAKVISDLGVPFGTVQYVYTDLSDGFLQHGRERFGTKYPFVEFRALNIETESEGQGTFDIILAANVLHATQSVDRTLANVKRLLRRNGILVLNELTASSAFTTVTFGLLDGWWMFEDAELRIPGTPLLSVSGWREALREKGFRNCQAFGLSNVAAQEVQSIIVAESDGLIPVRKALPTSIPSSAVNESRVKLEPTLPLLELVRREVALTLRLEPAEVDPQKRFSEYGVDSILSVALIGRINKALELALKTTVLFDYSSVVDLAEYLATFEKVIRTIAAPVSIPKTEPKPESLLSEKSPLGVIISGPGGIDDLRIEPIQVRTPDVLEIQIQVRAFSINFGDWLCIRGLYPTMPEYPFVPGFDVSGFVSEVGSGVTRFKIGDPVIALTGANFGGHAETVVVDERLAVAKPEEISFEDAAAFPVVFLTALRAFERAQVRAGEKVLIQTAAGGTGLMLVQLAQKVGAEIYAMAGSQDKLEYLTGLGVQHVINYRTSDFATEIRSLNNGRGVDVVFNTLSGEAIQKGFDLLEPNGRYIEIALSGLRSSRALDLSRLTKNQSIHSINLLELHKEDLETVPAYLDEMVRILREGKIIPTVAKIIPFSEIKEAFRELELRRNIGKIVVRVPDRRSKVESKAVETNQTVQRIAVVGMAGTFPAAEDIQEFWKNLAAGKNCITEIPSQRWAMDGFYDSNPGAIDRSVSKWGGFLSHVDQFDPLFFNISGREAERMDPQQRVFLEQAWHALEHAGYSGQALSESRCGLFVGTSGGDYYLKLRDAGIANDGFIFTGNQPSILAGRLAYFLNLKGPALAVDTACSSSLVAIHLACQSIRSGESDMALAGGVFINTTPTFHLLCSKAGMLSPSGQCKAFDDRADGFVPGEGAGVIVLKSLERALADGDQIYGVILGSGTNQDGKTNGITAPSAVSQTSLERNVYERHNIDPSSITYIETHGTGTKLGDPIEVDALCAAFQRYTKRTGFCALGSVKTNIGHSATAAGIASAIKVLLSFENEAIPPSLNFEHENAQLRLDETPFFVNTKLSRWENSGAPRRAAISSFGFSGTNCHLVMEEPPVVRAKQRSWKPALLFTLSAKTANALQMKRAQLLEWLEVHRESDLGAVSFTLNVGRDHFEYRIAFVANTVDELISVLRERRRSESLNSQTTDIEKLFVLLRTESSAPEYRTHLGTLADLYEQGQDVDWLRLYDGLKPQRTALPLYPFERQQYWIPDAKKPQPISDKSFQISCDELFIKDHVIDGHSILPAAIYLEWARSTVRGQSKTDAIVFRDSIWTLPFKVNGIPRQATVETQLGAAGERIVLRSNEGVHFETHAGALECELIASVDLASVRRRCSKVFRSKELYELFALHGICYGKSFQTISELRLGEQEAIAGLTAVAPEDHRWGWPPGLLDGALQTVVVLIEQHITGINSAFIPYGVEVLEIYSDSLPEKIVAHARLIEARESRFRFDIDILDEVGGVLLRIRGFGVRQLSPKKDRESGACKPEDSSSSNLQNQAEELLRRILAAELKIPPHAIRANDSFEKFGIDSLMIEEFNELLQKNFGPVSKTLFFECRTLQELANHFVQNHAGSLHRLLKLDRQIARSEAVNETTEAAAIHRSEIATSQHDEDIAIIGMSGRFPLAASVEEFWANLRSGRDCISEIPPERWDCARDFSSDPKAEGKVYTKWGGFIGGFDCFDPLFFKISPQEAELMDPQERHFLEIAYATIEDAGYTPASLRERSGQSRPKDVGVFVGVMWGDYQLYGAADPNNHASLPWSAYWSIANRVSYTFDFKGPSLAIDTACSSSLTAIHLACESLQRGQCRAALAGGVNLSLHPNKYRQLCQMKFASTDGKCRSFGAGGDGYVPGEGVGAVLLKPLSFALADGDQVYGVIKATGLNHGGKTNGYSVPNPIAQAEVIVDVLERSRVPAETIGFIEAHGTGTALGDPIEVTGLTRAFRQFTAKAQFCALGSAKANIGHLEAAAGVTALIKVLLQMQHRELPPSLHVETLNPNLSLEETPFKIRRELTEWEQPVHNGKIEPRRAGVSSFGAGGANAHIIVEEPPEMRLRPKTSQTELIILSARTKEQLLKKAGQLKAKLETHPEINLAGLASTLKIGREAMDYRFAVCVSDTGDLSAKLEVLLTEAGKNLEIADGKALAEEINAEDEAYLESLYKNRKFEKLGKLWTGGRNVDWMRLMANEAPQVRVSLPTYPFARDRYWIPKPRPSVSEPGANHSRAVLPEDAYYTTQWISAPLIYTNGYHSKGAVQLLLFDDSAEFAAQWEQAKNGSMFEIRVVTKATDHPSATGKNFSIRPGVQADYQWLVERLLEEKFTPTDVVLLWSYRATEPNIHLVSETPNLELLTLFYITKALQSSFYANSIRLQHVFRKGNPFDIAVSGFGRSLERETPNYKIKSLQMNGAPFAPEELRQIIWKEIHGSFANGEIRYDGNGRMARETISVPQPGTSVEVGFRRGGVYVITGGLGELGTEFARLLSKHYSARIVLMGRSPLNQERGKKLDAIRAVGTQVEYLQTDLSNRDQLNDALEKTREKFGAINGILHLACVVEDALLYRKSSENFRRVLAPKIEGTLYLDELTKSDALDFFVSFSSAVSLTGNAGQVDYAAACRFQDAFAEYRNEMSVKGMRSGRSLTIAWSQWEKAGHFAPRTMLEAGGIKLLSIEHGWEALQACLGKTGNFYAVIDGDRAKINKLLRIQSDGVDRAPFSEPELSEEEIDIQLRDLFTDGSAEDIELVRGLIPSSSRNGNTELVISRNRSVTSPAMGQIEDALKDRLKLVLQPSDRRKPLTDFGLDSINAVKLADDLQKRLGLEVNPKIFWDSPTLEALAAALDAQLNKEAYP